jgi:hypothetical protein
MPTEDLDAISTIRQIAADCCQALFEVYGLCLERDDQIGHVDELLYCGVMGFVGQKLRGACLLAATSLPLERSRPVEGSVRDWTGELANQLMGKIKIRLLAHGVTVAMTTPIVLRGEHLAPLPRKNLAPIVFTARPGAVLLWVELEVEDGLVLRPAASAPCTAGEGEVLLF